jgi:hypothetical protein
MRHRSGVFYDPIGRWEWEGGAVAAADMTGRAAAGESGEQPPKPAAHPQHGSAVDLDDLEPALSTRRVDGNDVADAPPE